MRNFLCLMQRTILGGVLSILLLSCQKHEAKVSEPKGLGKYIYRDDNDIYHIEADCVKLRRGKDDAGHDLYAKHLMDTSNFIITHHEYFRVCSHCVNDSEYEHLLQISDNNSMADDTIAISNPWWK